jgi:acetyltransferase-like isoleucine patch superfamily enzyme
VTLGKNAFLAPNVSLRNGERIVIGAGTNIGERGYLWAGDTTGRITIGENCRFGPEVFVTASDYGRMPDQNIHEQARDERDVAIGNDVWLGARVFVGTGVTIGDGCVVSAGSVVTRDLPPHSIAVGIPARVVRRREDYAQNGRSEAHSEPEPVS